MPATQVPTFMLLPDYSHAPDKDILLGTVLLLSKETKLPDPDLPVNETSRVNPSDDIIKRQVEAPWTFHSGDQRSWSGSLDADIPVFAPAGGGFGYGTKKSESFTIKCDRVDTQRFVPSRTYIAQTLQDDFIRDYCRKQWFPSVYLVTGIKVAHKAVIQCADGSGQDIRAQLAVDGTTSGVPIKAGPSLETSKETSRDVGTTIAGPFVLAYQLKRLRLKKDASLKEVESFNKFALFDDDVSKSSSPDALLESWDVDDIDLNSTFDS